MLATNGETKTPTGGAGLPSTLRMESYKLSISEKMYSNKGAHLSEQSTSEPGGRVETKSLVVAYVGTKWGGECSGSKDNRASFISQTPTKC